MLSSPLGTLSAQHSTILSQKQTVYMETQTAPVPVHHKDGEQVGDAQRQCRDGRRPGQPVLHAEEGRKRGAREKLVSLPPMCAAMGGGEKAQAGRPATGGKDRRATKAAQGPHARHGLIADESSGPTFQEGRATKPPESAA